MFHNCSSLEKISNITCAKQSKENKLKEENNFEKMDSKIDKKLPPDSKYNIINNETMINNEKESSSKSNFTKQYLLPLLNPKWNYDTIINMRSMFEGCQSLISLPDISE